MKILVLNAGSSTQKSRLYELNDSLPATPPPPLWEANADWTKGKHAVELKVSTAQGQDWQHEIPAGSRSEVTEQMLKTLWSGATKVIDQPADISLVGHRVVHGGADYVESVVITPQVKEKIKELAHFAPLHNPINLEGIESVEQVLGNVPQVAVFDTAFHKHLPTQTIVYPGPYDWFEQGIRRYGFHGISHQYCVERIGQVLREDPQALRIINCHLGNGCSLAAIRQGRSVDTTMGFTPLEGLMMGTRSGTVDPSILIYLQRQQSYSADKLEEVLNKQSGLKGISNISGDLRQIHKAVAEGNERARLALDMYIYRLRYFISAMLPILGDVDVLSFTGGAGENDAELRARACEGFAFLDLKIDLDKNAQSPADQVISTSDSRVRVLIIHTEEDWEIAKESWELMRKA